MANLLPPPPTSATPGSYAWTDWYNKLYQFSSTAGVPWASVDKTGSSLSDLATRTHNSLQSLQGGTSGEYYHLTNAQQTSLLGSANSTLHFHTADRARANHTGTQTISTLSDLPVLASGTYTPTLTNVANLDASTARLATYMRVGATVTVSGQVDVDPTTTATLTKLGISLPVASALTTAFQLGGTAAAIGIAGQSAGIQADATNDRAEMQWKTSDITNQTMTYTFTYQVI